MSYNGNSPSHGYGGFEGDPLMEAYNNARFSQEISDKMKVPKRIAANGYEIDHDLMNSNHMAWNNNEKFDMTVPDRIVVIGQDQHLGEFTDIIFFMLANIFLVFTFLLPSTAFRHSIIVHALRLH